MRAVKVVSNVIASDSSPSISTVMPVHTSIRPVTSKARGICKYYTTPRGCFAGESCKFLHQQPDCETKEGEQPPLTPYDKSKRCKYFDQGA